MKTVLITGAGARVGRYLASGLAAENWHVVIHYNRSLAGAEAQRDAILATGGKASIVQANLNIPEDLDTLIDRASASANAPLTALINNASTFTPDAPQTLTRAMFDHHMDVNLWAALRLSQGFAAQIPADAGGVIINMIDQRVLSPRPDFFTYYLAKSALLTATQTLAQNLAPHIRVNAVGPGPTLGNIHQASGEFDHEVASTLLGTGSPPDTILDAVRYLLSARAVTGQMIAVDGGQHLNFSNEDVS